MYFTIGHTSTIGKLLRLQILSIYQGLYISSFTFDIVVKRNSIRRLRRLSMPGPREGKGGGRGLMKTYTSTHDIRIDIGEADSAASKEGWYTYVDSASKIHTLIYSSTLNWHLLDLSLTVTTA